MIRTMKQRCVRNRQKRMRFKQFKHFKIVEGIGMYITSYGNAFIYNEEICGATKHMINRDTRLHCRALTAKLRKMIIYFLPQFMANDLVSCSSILI